ncbi:alpha-glucuronidase [Lacticaseibacillus jixiensis]|uniref:alpha-glucuronidase n=1 Tax=Lacticaseibacillus jixiensis TaxID=3231926 RepID=UPI0036F1F95D
MSDKFWLNQAVIEKTTPLAFYIGDVDEDVVSLNLRSEIITYFRAKLCNRIEQADVILTTGGPQSGFTIDVAEQTTIMAQSTADLLHGFYYFVMHHATGSLPTHVESIPSQALRMLDHWDNFDGTIERGYAGRSIFYEDNHFRGDMARIQAYARMMASVGLNAISLNNVNVHAKETFFITGENLARIGDIAAVFSQFGIKSFLAINFAAPLRFGACDTADPLDASVQDWWQQRIDDIYRVIPDFGGFLVKADSEGQPGPFYYGRDHADGANMLAKALAPHNGLVIWRAFVYNSQQDWRDRSIDRAKAAYDHFKPLDGKFAANVILQVKFGPIDFQPREPVQPLFGQMHKTNLIVEFEITQEYTGHQIDTNYLATQWAEILAFDTAPDGRSLPLWQVPKVCSPTPSFSGIAAVSSIGRDDNWTGNKLMQANVYAFGRLAWQSDMSTSAILAEWIPLTFQQPQVQAVVSKIMTTSNQTYIDYTAPLGVGFMVKSGFHYGPGINDYEYDRWGTYHFADRNGIGVDRTVGSGTGYIGQYTAQNAELYENIHSCPDEFLLFFHHVPYTHVLQDGVSVIQHIYNTHFSGYEKVAEYLAMWQTLVGKLDADDYQNILERLKLQLANAREWRDQVNTFFYRMSGIEDVQHRKIYL